MLSESCLVAVTNAKDRFIVEISFFGFHTVVW